MASSSASPSPARYAGVRQRRALQLQRLQQPAAVLVAESERRVPVEPQQVEDHVRDGDLAHLAPDGRVRGQVHARLQALEARPALLVEGDDLAVEDHPLGAHGAAELSQLRIAGGEVGPRAAEGLHVPAVEVDHRAHAVPLDLVAPSVVVARQLARAGLHRLDALGHGLGARVARRVHAVDQPVLALGVDERVAALDPLALQHHDHLVVAELLGHVGAPVPDLHRAGAVRALGDVAVELQVLERVVLGAHGQAVLVGVDGDAPRQGPGGEYPVALEAQVPVQPSGVVLLDDEARALPVGLAPRRAPGSGRSRASACRSRASRPCPRCYGPCRAWPSSVRRSPRRFLPAVGPTSPGPGPSRPTAWPCAPMGAWWSRASTAAAASWPCGAWAAASGARPSAPRASAVTACAPWSV